MKTSKAHYFLLFCLLAIPLSCLAGWGVAWHYGFWFGLLNGVLALLFCSVFVVFLRKLLDRTLETVATDLTSPLQNVLRAKLTILGIGLLIIVFVPIIFFATPLRHREPTDDLVFLISVGELLVLFTLWRTYIRLEKLATANQIIEEIQNPGWSKSGFPAMLVAASVAGLSLANYSKKLALLAVLSVMVSYWLYRDIRKMWGGTGAQKPMKTNNVNKVVD